MASNDRSVFTNIESNDSPLKRLSSSYSLLSVQTPNTPTNNTNNTTNQGGSPTLQLFGASDNITKSDHEEDVVKKMPGGSWAVFRGERKNLNS